MSLLQYKYANYSNPLYTKTGKNSIKFQLINQRADFSFALFSGGLSNVCSFATLMLHCISNIFSNLGFFLVLIVDLFISVTGFASVLFYNFLKNFLLYDSWTNLRIWILQPKLVAISNYITFTNPKAPLYPRLAQGKSWNEVSSS